MSLTDAEKNRLKRVGLTGLNKPKRTPKHPTKKAVVAVRDGSKIKVIRFAINMSPIFLENSECVRIAGILRRRT